MSHCPLAAQSRCPGLAPVGRGRAGTCPGTPARCRLPVPVTRAPPAGAVARLHTGAPCPTRDRPGAGLGTSRGSRVGRWRRWELPPAMPATAPGLLARQREGRCWWLLTAGWGLRGCEQRRAQRVGKTYVGGNKFPPPPRGTFPSRFSSPGSPKHVSKEPRYPKMGGCPKESRSHARSVTALRGPAPPAEPRTLQQLPPPARAARIEPNKSFGGEVKRTDGGAQAVTQRLPRAPPRGRRGVGLAQTPAPGRRARLPSPSRSGLCRSPGT